MASKNEFLDTSRFADWFRAIRQVRGDFRTRHHCAPRLLRPRKYTEKVQWRKLFDLDPLYAVLSDKIAARDFIASRVGPDVLVPLLWVGDDPDSLPFDTLDPPYVIKSNHAVSQVIFVDRREDVDVAAARVQMKQWLAHCHGTALCEPGYVPVPRRIMVERRLVEPDGARPLERRLFVFNGRVQYIQTTRELPRLAAFHDRDWNQLDWYFLTQPSAELLPRPARFDEMISLAERLGAGRDHVRVDLYDTHDGVRVGELTLYSWSGHHPMNPPEADYILGSCWHVERPMLRAIGTVLTKRRAITPAPPPRASARPVGAPNDRLV